MKRLLSLVLALAMFSCAVPVTAEAPVSLDILMQEIDKEAKALEVSELSFEISENGQSVYIDRPEVTGSEEYTIAYNIYDSDSNPVNYFYSLEERVAATPGYAGLFNVFVVVTDLVTEEQVNQNIGWHDLLGPNDPPPTGDPTADPTAEPTEPLTVAPATFEISENQQSIFIDKPAITGGSGSFTIAYNIYDADSNPVNYFYSDEARVAATPGYAGLFNVFIVVTDTVTGAQNTQNIGWNELAGPPTDNPDGIDFGGRTIYIYDFWTSTPSQPTEEQRALMEAYNCQVIQIHKGDWGSNATELINFVVSPDDTLCLYILPPDFVATPMMNGCLAAWNGPGMKINLNSDKWNSATTGFMTLGGRVYGTSVGRSEPRQCVYFNKRVLEEAGIDWNSIYDMQAAGTWTFSAFESLLKKVQRDTDNDGVPDIYGMTGSSIDLYRVAVFANGGSFFDSDASGKLTITAGSSNAVSALNWAKNAWSTYAYPQPEDASWDYYKEAWKQGFCGFYVYQTYGGFNPNGEMSDMDDEWGCVAFPKGPSGTRYVTIVSDNVTVIPAVYDDETTAALARIYDLWTGKPDDTSWVGNKPSLTDERAVYETYGMLRKPEHCVSDKALLLGSVNDVEGSGFLWELPDASVTALIEAKTPVWQNMIDLFNGD